MSERVVVPDKMKTVPRSSPGGHLAKYQEKITKQYLDVVNQFENNVQQISNECQKKMKERMQKYKEIESECNNQCQDLLNSMGTTDVLFDELKSKIIQIGNTLVQAEVELETDIRSIYENSFASIKPEVDRSYSLCREYLDQIGPQYHDKLEERIDAINISFKNTYEQLLKVLHQFELCASRFASTALDNFSQKTDDWKNNRFETLITKAREQLKTSNPDFGNLLNEFHSEQLKFSLCFQKLVQEFALILPPEHFNKDELTQWWSKVEEMLLFHSNFIDIFVGKISTKLNDDVTNSGNLLQEIEPELIELKGDAEASNALSELTPLFRTQSKLSQAYIEKLTKYWENRREVLKKSFESIKDYFEPMLESYDQYSLSTMSAFEKYQEDINKIDKESEDELEKLESQYQIMESEIGVLATEQKINQKVVECKQVLGNIQQSYRTHYEKTVALYDQQPEIFKGIFDSSETDIIGKLKVRKTANAPLFDSVSMAVGSSRSGRKQSPGRKTINTRQQRMKRGKADNNQTIFSFAASTGAKYEEIENLIIIPPIEEYQDDALLQTTKGAKGKKPPVKKHPQRKTPVKNAKGKKSAADSDNEDLPEINIVQAVPKIDDVPIITIYIPENKELSQFISEFRQSMLEDINNRYHETIKRTAFKSEREQMADQLNERLRMHAPRANALEMNTAKTRILHIESRKVQLEKHFHHNAIIFNKGLMGIESSLEVYKNDINKRIDEINEFTAQISEIKVSAHFVDLEAAFKISEKSLLKFLEERKEKMETEVSQFLSSFKQTNDRFIETVVNGDDTFSQDERKMAMQYFDKMNSQVDSISNALAEKIRTTANDGEQKYQQLADEFQQTIPKHILDVKFHEEIKGHHHQAKTKYDTLLFRNRRQEYDLDSVIDNLRDIQETESEIDQQKSILIHLETLDRMRTELLKRAKYLCLMKSDISHDPLAFSFDLSKPIGGDSKDKESTGSSADKKKQRRMSKTPIKPMKPGTKKQILPPQDQMYTMQGQIDQIGNALIAAVTKSATDYFNGLKATKSTITRTQLIKPTLNECIEESKTKWSTVIADSGKIISESALKFRSQLFLASSLARISTTLIYDNYESYYISSIKEIRKTSQESIESTLSDLIERRKEHIAQITPKIADANNISHLKTLLKKEQMRRDEEKAQISAYNTSVIEAERAAMNLFTTHLTPIASMVMQIFDKFPLIEDLIPGEVEKTEKRKTLTELLKEKERKSSGVDDADRPFKQRQWPSLLISMEPLATIAPPNSETPTSSRSASKKSKRRSLKDTSKIIEQEVTPPITSLDTRLHRGCIVEQSRAYTEYQSQLQQRITDFGEYVKKLEDDELSFEEYWKKAITAIAPNAFTK